MRLLSDSLTLDGRGSRQQQLYRALRGEMLGGSWQSGALLPSSRTLATDLGLSRNTVNQVLQQLVAEGYIEGQPGRGYCIVALPEHFFHATHSEVRQQPALAVQDYQLPTKTVAYNGLLQPGISALTQFPFALWQRLLQRHCQRIALSGFAEPMGYLPLRQALARYLPQARQVVCDEHNILITAGAQQALFIAAKLVARAGEQVLMESPGYPRLKQALQLAELKVQHLDASQSTGLDINKLPAHCKAKAVFLTPGHQYPLGGIMPLPQRVALLDWARQQGVWLVEDDYDSEFQYQHRPIASLQGIAGGEGVLFVGSFSKTMFPALRLGYLVAPRRVISQAATLLQALHGDVPLLPQAALADFIDEGHYGRHLRKMRAHYSKRKTDTIALLQQGLPQCKVAALAAGLHLVLLFPTPLDEAALLAELVITGIRTQPLSRYLFNAEPLSGLVLGIASHSDHEYYPALQRLIALCQQAIIAG